MLYGQDEINNYRMIEFGDKLSFDKVLVEVQQSSMIAGRYYCPCDPPNCVNYEMTPDTRDEILFGSKKSQQAAVQEINKTSPKPIFNEGTLYPSYMYREAKIKARLEERNIEVQNSLQNIPPRLKWAAFQSAFKPYDPFDMTMDDPNDLAGILHEDQFIFPAYFQYWMVEILTDTYGIKFLPKSERTKGVKLHDNQDRAAASKAAAHYLHDYYYHPYRSEDGQIGEKSRGNLKVGCLTEPSFDKLVFEIYHAISGDDIKTGIYNPYIKHMEDKLKRSLHPDFTKYFKNT